MSHVGQWRHLEDVPLCRRYIQKMSCRCPQDCQGHVGRYLTDVLLKSNGTILGRLSDIILEPYFTEHSSNGFPPIPLIVNTRCISYAISWAALDAWCILQLHIRNMPLCTTGTLHTLPEQDVAKHNKGAHLPQFLAHLLSAVPTSNVQRGGICLLLVTINTIGRNLQHTNI